MQTNTKPLVLSKDMQALAELLTELGHKCQPTPAEFGDVDILVSGTDFRGEAFTSRVNHRTWNDTFWATARIEGVTCTPLCDGIWVFRLYL